MLLAKLLPAAKPLQGDTVPDCTLDSAVISITQLPHLSTDELARIVGTQEPGGYLLNARDYVWRFLMLPTRDLEHSNEDGEAPEGGWTAAHERHLAADQEAVENGSPEYDGRGEWLREVWCPNTAIYPLFVSLEEGEYRIWDGYRRLAGAFYYGVEQVAVILGTPRF